MKQKNSQPRFIFLMFKSCKISKLKYHGRSMPGKKLFVNCKIHLQDSFVWEDLTRQQEHHGPWWLDCTSPLVSWPRPKNDEEAKRDHGTEDYQKSTSKDLSVQKWTRWLTAGEEDHWLTYCYTFNYSSSNTRCLRHISAREQKVT